MKVTAQNQKNHHEFSSIPEFDRAMRKLIHVPKGKEPPATKPKKKVERKVR